MRQFISTLISDIRSLPGPVYILVLGQFLNRFGSFVYPFLSLYLKENGYPLAHISGVFAAMGLGNFLGPIVGGYLADAIGRRNTIAVSLFGSAISLFSLYYCNDYTLLLVTASVFGCVNFIYGPPASALITDLVSPEKRIIAFTMTRLAINAGFAAGPMVAGLLYTKSPFLIFAGDAATTLLFAVLAFAFLPHGLRTIDGRATSPTVFLRSWKEAFQDVLGNFRYKQFLIAVFLLGLSFIQVFNLLALATEQDGIAPSTYGFIMGFNGILIIIIEIPLIQWLKRFDSRRILALGYVLIALGCAAFGFVHTLPGYLAAMSIFTLGEIIALPIGLAYSSNLAPERYRGRYFGFRGMTWAIGSLVGSAGVWIYGHIGNSWWAISGSTALLAGAIISLQGKGNIGTETHET